MLTDIDSRCPLWLCLGSKLTGAKIDVELEDDGAIVLSTPETSLSLGGNAKPCCPDIEFWRDAESKLGVSGVVEDSSGVPFASTPAAGDFAVAAATRFAGGLSAGFELVTLMRLRAPGRTWLRLLLRRAPAPAATLPNRSSGMKSGFGPSDDQGIMSSPVERMRFAAAAAVSSLSRDGTRSRPKFSKVSVSSSSGAMLACASGLDKKGVELSL